MPFIAPPPPARGIRSHGLEPGTVAPPFALPATPDGKLLRLEDFRGRALLLVFYPADFTPVCTSELGIFNELRGELDQLGASVLGLSVDSIWTHLAFAKEHGLDVPLLSDFHPKGDVARRYGVYREEDGFCERANFVLDGEGRIFWKEVSPIEVNPGADQAIAALERLTGRHLSDAASLEAQP
jgi:peroxiredoxin